MKFTSNWSQGALFWRTFNKGDTVYLVGLRDGTIDNGATVSYENPSGFFQLELKRGGLFGQTLVPPGHVYANDDEYIVTDDGAMISVEDAASVTIDPGFKFQPYGSVVQFFSQGSTDSSITITSTVTQTTTQSGSSQTTISSEASDETDSQVGGKETASGGTGLKLGVEVSESVSSKVSSKISEVVSTQLSVTVATATTYTEVQPITLKAGKLTAIESSWQRRYVTGSVVVGASHFTYDATIGYVSSRKVSEFDSPDDLPPELMAAYMQQNPGYLPPVDLSDGSVLREQNSAPVDVIFGGAKFWIPSGQVLNDLYGGWSKVVVVPDGSLEPVPTTPRDGTILREENSPEVWLIEGGDKRHIVSPDVLNRYGGWGSVRVVPDSATANFPAGAPVT